MKSLRSAALALASVLSTAALAQSTIDATAPATGSPFSSAPVRNNFAAAKSDINTLYGLQPVINIKRVCPSITTGSDITACITSTQALLPSAGGTVYVPEGSFAMTPGNVTIAAGQGIVCAGKDKTTINVTIGLSADLIVGSGANGSTVSDCGFNLQGVAATGNFAPIDITGSDVTITRNNFIGFDRSAVEVGNGARIRVTHNHFHRNATSGTTLNEAITAVCSSGAVYDSFFDWNVVENTGMSICARNSSASHNRITGFAYGSGITTAADPNSFAMRIVGNDIAGGTGIDANSTSPNGVENWAGDSVISGNVLQSNAGAGIANQGSHTAITGNVIYNNGTYAGAAGISLAYYSATYNPQFSQVSGNTIFDTSGAAGTQTYGITEIGSPTNITYTGNNVQGNKTAGYGTIGTQSSVSGEVYEWQTAGAAYTLAAGAQIALVAVTAPGAAFGDYVNVKTTFSHQGCIIWGEVNAANQIFIYYFNPTGAAVTFTATGTITAMVQKGRLQ